MQEIKARDIVQLPTVFTFITFNFTMAATPLTPQEIDRYRQETAGTSTVTHFNNAGASLPPDVVVDAVIGYLKEEATFGGYETETKYSQQLNSVYGLIAKLINADESEVAVVESASVAWGVLFNGLDLQPGDEVLISEMEYVSNLMGFINAKKNRDVRIVVVPNDADGNFSLDALEAAITPKTKLIAATHISSSAGGVMSVAEIGRVARKHNILYLLDACQSAGQVPLDVQAIGCDMLSVTGRKYLRAPRGTGFLYARKSVQDRIKPILMDSFAAESVTETSIKFKENARKFELYEKNRALTLGLAKAVEYALNVDVERIWERVQHLAGHLRTKLRQIPGVTVHDIGSHQCGIVTFSVAGKNAAMVKDLLAESKINVSLAKAVSTLIYMNKQHLDTVVRASVHYYNTEAEVEKLCEAVRRLATA